MEEALKIMTLSTLQGGGAGVAADRLHQCLDEVGVLSATFTLNKVNEDPRVVLISAQKDGAPVCLWSAVRRSWDKVASQFKHVRWDAGFLSFPFGVSSKMTRLDSHVQHFDIIHFHWVAGLIDFREAAQIFGKKPIVWTLHDMNPFTGGCHYSQECRSYETECHTCPLLGQGAEQHVSASWNLKRSVYEDLNITVVAPSQWLADCSKKSRILGGFNHHVIPYGIDTSIFKKRDKQAAREALDLPHDASVILFGATGITDPRKGLDLLFHALRLLAERKLKRKVMLLIFGQDFGVDIPEFAFETRYLGHISEKQDLVTAYSAADVFALPSRADNLPNTCIESLCCGTPVVGFKIGGMPDMVQHRENGYLADPYEISDLSDGIEWTLDASSHELSERIAQSAHSEYDQKVQATRYKELYQSLMSEPES